MLITNFVEYLGMCHILLSLSLCWMILLWNVFSNASILKECLIKGSCSNLCRDLRRAGNNRVWIGRVSDWNEKRKKYINTYKRKEEKNLTTKVIKILFLLTRGGICFIGIPIRIILFTFDFQDNFNIYGRLNRMGKSCVI